jgi:hypothetical protein
MFGNLALELGSIEIMFGNCLYRSCLVQWVPYVIHAFIFILILTRPGSSQPRASPAGPPPVLLPATPPACGPRPSAAHGRELRRSPAASAPAGALLPRAGRELRPPACGPRAPPPVCRRRLPAASVVGCKLWPAAYCERRRSRARPTPCTRGSSGGAGSSLQRRGRSRRTGSGTWRRGGGGGAGRRRRRGGGGVRKGQREKRRPGEPASAPLSQAKMLRHFLRTGGARPWAALSSVRTGLRELKMTPNTNLSP